MLKLWAALLLHALVCTRVPLDNLLCTIPLKQLCAMPQDYFAIPLSLYSFAELVLSIALLHAQCVSFYFAPCRPFPAKSWFFSTERVCYPAFQHQQVFYVLLCFDWWFMFFGKHTIFLCSCETVACRLVTTHFKLWSALFGLFSIRNEEISQNPPSESQREEQHVLFDLGGQYVAWHVLDWTHVLFTCPQRALLFESDFPIYRTFSQHRPEASAVGLCKCMKRPANTTAKNAKVFQGKTWHSIHRLKILKMSKVKVSSV